jgi:hypothetical protein
LPITTVYNPEQFLTTSSAILREWLTDYIGDVDITFEIPFLDESIGIQRPILYLELMPGSHRFGMGKVMTNTTRGNIYKVEYMASWIVNNYIGGQPRVKELAENMYMSFLDKSKVGYLASAGLRYPKCSTLREIPKSSYSEFFGGRHLITFDIEVYYTG